MIAKVDHGEVIQQVTADGRFSYSYAFMVTASAGIATIGLLLNSPAVIVGAMLISPLMGPITLSGLSVALASPRRAALGGGSLLAGIVLSLGVSIAIVQLSPLHNVTSEILARTRPNLFDLLVAIFAGLAGGYAVIRGRGSAIVGVAIATALMPPLAAVGYGVATQTWHIAEGAGLMFITNMFAIGLAVAFMSTWYGFGRRELRQRLAWQTLLAAAILIPLAIPLLNTLRTIATEATITSTARTVLQDLVARDGPARLAQFEVGFPPHQPLQITAVSVTRRPDPGLSARAERELASQLGRPVALELEQVSSSATVTPVANVLAAPTPQPKVAEEPRESLADQLRRAFPLPLRLIDVDAAGKRITIMPSPAASAPLDTLQAMEAQLAGNFPTWHVALIPPPQAFVPVTFDAGSRTLGTAQLAQVRGMVWALHAWQIGEVQVVGHASTLGQPRANAALALARARAVAEALQSAGIRATITADYPAPGQLQLERQRGLAAYRVVEVQPIAPVAAR